MLEGYSDAHGKIKELVREYSKSVIVKPSGMTVNHKGQLVNEISHYSEEEDVIYMEDNIDNDLYADTYKHEFGHFLDAHLGRPSMGENFTYAMQADKEMLLYETGENSFIWKEMLENLGSGNALYNMYISDILSAQFYDELEIMQEIKTMYYENNAAFYGHAEEYWDGIIGPKCAANREIFANVCALYSENDVQSVEFLEKWFPNVSRRFWKELE